MRPRFNAVLTLVAAHAAAIVVASQLPDRLAEVVAGSISRPLRPFDALGIPVFGTAGSWGWASPSVLGWGVLVVWVGLWWAVVEGLSCILRPRIHAS